MAVRYQGGPHSNLSAILSKMANPHPMYPTPIVLFNAIAP